MTAPFSQPDFETTLNETYTAAIDAETSVDLKLVEVSELKRSGPYESFSILFHGPQETPLPQQVYSIRHQDIGSKDVFMVPVGQTETGFHYEAVFNYKSEAEEKT